MPPPLVTTVSFDDTVPGALGQPGSQVKMGSQRIDLGWRSGVRLAARTWSLKEDKFGWEGMYFLLPKETKKREIRTSGLVGAIAYAVPIFDVTGLWGLGNIPGKTVFILPGPIEDEPGFFGLFQLKSIRKSKGISMEQHFGGPLHYLGNRNLKLPDLSGRMVPDNTWLKEHFSIISPKKKYKKCFEPFAGCASWSLSAMEHNLAEEYIINDSNKALIGTLLLIKEDPDSVKSVYSKDVKDFCKSRDKKDFFLKKIEAFNKASENEKSLLLPFIINHSWSGLLFHDEHCHILYREPKIKGKVLPGYLDAATLPLELFYQEVDYVSDLFNTNTVTFKSGDFLDAVTDVQKGDFVALNPPYPENERSEKEGMYVELYSPIVLHQKLVDFLKKMDESGIQYYMTYGFHNPKMQEFVIRDGKEPRHYLRIFGYKDCAWGMALDQMYFSKGIKIPADLQAKIIPAAEVLKDPNVTTEEAMNSFVKIAQKR